MPNYVGTPIVGATSATYDAQSSDVGEYLFCDVTATNTAGSTTQSSNLVGPIAAAPGATFDPAKKGTHITLTNSNRTATGDAVDWAAVLSTSSRATGLVYAEFELTTVDAGQTLFGFANNDQDLNSFLTASGNAAFVRRNSGSPGASGKFSAGGTEPTYTGVDGGTIGIALNLTAGKAWVSYDNVFGGDPVAGTGALFTWTADASAIFLAFSTTALSAATIKTASSQLKYSPPSGFTAWGA